MHRKSNPKPGVKPHKLRGGKENIRGYSSGGSGALTAPAPPQMATTQAFQMALMHVKSLCQSLN